MMSSKKPFISFVVLSWNTLKETTTALQSIREQNYKNYELIVVDNGSSDGSKEYLAKQKDILYIDLPKNTGFTGGQLAAYAKSKGDYIALVNSDAVIAKDWCDILVNKLEADKTIAVAAGRGYTWNEGEKPYDTSNKFYSYQVVHPYSGYARTLMSGQGSCFVDAISGSGVIIRRSVIEEVGYFDDTFFAYYEETDLFARYKRAGYTILYEPTAHTWHMVGASSKGKAAEKSYSFFYLYQMQRNRFLFAIKNYDAHYARKFFWRYAYAAMHAHYRYARTRHQEYRAQVKAFWWNMSHLLQTLHKRRSIMKLGGSYNQTIISRNLPTDVTVIIPCYNYASFVSEAIESVLAQTHKPERIILINDGSTDNSLEVAQKYKKHIEIIDQPNSGVVAAKNRCMQLVDTTWTIFFDADDIMSETYIEELLTKAQKDNADVVYTDMQYFGAKTGVHKARKFSMTSLLKGNYIHNSALIGTDYLREIGGYKKEMAGGYEDWELYITLAEAGAKFSYLPKANFHYRQKEQSRNAQAEEKAYRLLLTVRELHRASYLKYRRSPVKLIDISKKIYHNPFVLVVALYSLPISLLSGVRGFLRTAKSSYLFRVKAYLNKREEARKHVDDDES